jgi:hypothetical protein
MLTPDAQRTITNFVRRGNYLITAAAAAGVSRQSVLKWRLRGEREKSGRYHDFARALQLAHAQAEANMVAAIENVGYRDWTACAWLLERTRSTRWGRFKTANFADMDSAV